MAELRLLDSWVVPLAMKESYWSSPGYRLQRYCLSVDWRGSTGWPASPTASATCWQKVSVKRFDWKASERIPSASLSWRLAERSQLRVAS